MISCVRRWRVFSVMALVLAVLLAGASPPGLVGFGQVGPFWENKWIRPPPGAQPPEIVVFSPTGEMVSASNSVCLIFNSSAEGIWNLNFLTLIYYETNWQEGNVTVYKLDMSTPNQNHISSFSYDENLTGIPDGNRSITVFAAAHGGYAQGLTYYYFDVGGSSTVNFTVDTTPPEISVLSPQNKSYDAANVTLNFTLNEAVSQVSYVLDGEENHLPAEINPTLTGTTLTGLSNSEHNVTVYATDLAGNAGASETVYFTVKVPEPFPTTLVAVASVTAVAAVIAGLLVYHRKRKREVNGGGGGI